jgi:hypothetical protein
MSDFDDESDLGIYSDDDDDLDIMVSPQNYMATHFV